MTESQLRAASQGLQSSWTEILIPSPPSVVHCVLAREYIEVVPLWH